MLDLRGKRFGRLTVIGYVPGRRFPQVKARLVCACDCGKEAAPFRENILSGRTQSCGCHKADGAWTHIKHGHNRGTGETPEYISWRGMIARCRNPKSSNYARYGGAGIAVYELWIASFADFLGHIGPKPSPAHTIDRIDGTRGYEPGNVRWATLAEQALNKPTTKLFVSELPSVLSRIRSGETRVSIAKSYGLTRTAVSAFLRRHHVTSSFAITQSGD